MTKKRIGLAQLTTAAKLYTQGNYVCAITLAGAAEEIFGQMSKLKCGANRLTKDKYYLASIYDYAKKPIPSSKALVANINRAKTELKHNNTGKNSHVKMDFENEVALMIVKAVHNFLYVYKKIPNDIVLCKVFEELTL